MNAATLAVSQRPRWADGTTTVISAANVREAEIVIDRLADVIAFFEVRISDPRTRRHVRAVMLYLFLLASTNKSFFISALPELLDALHPKVRSRLELAAGGKLSYKQILTCFHQMAASVDPSPHFAGAGLDDAELEQRASDLQWVLDRMMNASTADGPTHGGSYAVDTTMKWAHARPPGGGSKKIDRRGNDGEAGAPLSLGDVLDGGSLHDAGIEPGPAELAEAMTALAADVQTEATSQDESPAANVMPAPLPPIGPPRRRGRQTLDPDATWLGHKFLFGFGIHYIVRVAERDEDVPCVVERFAVTRSTANPAGSVMPLLRRLRDERAQAQDVTALVTSGHGRVLSDVIADCGFSQAVAGDWQLPIKALGGNPIYRLHAQNQAGWRSNVRGLPMIDGSPFCPCMPDEMRELRFPAFPAKRSVIAAYQAAIARRAQFALVFNQTTPSGAGQFRTPHHRSHLPGGDGGCEHCVDAFGNAVVDDTGTAKRRCCTKATYSFTAEQLALQQTPLLGTTEWFERWNQRSRVEGFNGVVKNLAVANLGRNYHRFRGLAHESLICGFATMATNRHMLRHWRARQELGAQRSGGSSGLSRHLPSRQPTQTLPLRQLPPAKPRGRKGMEALSQPRAGP